MGLELRIEGRWHICTLLRSRQHSCIDKGKRKMMILTEEEGFYKELSFWRVLRPRNRVEGDDARNRFGGGSAKKLRVAK